MPRVYFDTCCLNRPFDDQKQDRIRLEAEAVLLIMARLRRDDYWLWIASDVVQYETGRIPDLERRRRIQALLQFIDHHQTADAPTGERAIELCSLGFRAVDALHVACAESANCDVILTTDDRMLNAAGRNATSLHVRVANPVDWLREFEEP